MPTIHSLGSSQETQNNFSSILQGSRHGKHKNPNYHREYYQKNREKLLTYSKEFYGIKKLLESLKKTSQSCLNERKQHTKNGVKKFSFTGTRDITFSNKHKIYKCQELKKT